MKKDFSKLLYDRYFKLTNRNIEMILKDGKIIRGTIIGFFKGDQSFNEPYVTTWHLVDGQDKTGLGTDAFAYLEGHAIEQSDILQVKFCADNTVLKFYE